LCYRAKLYRGKSGGTAGLKGCQLERVVGPFLSPKELYDRYISFHPDTTSYINEKISVFFGKNLRVGASINHQIGHLW